MSTKSTLSKSAIHVGLQGKLYGKESIVVALTICHTRSEIPEHRIPEQVRVRYLEAEGLGGYETLEVEQYIQHYSVRLFAF